MTCKVPNATVHFCDNVCRHRRECEDLDNDFVVKMQKVVKDYADAHPGEITLPCEKHHRLPCQDCGVKLR